MGKGVKGEGRGPEGKGMGREHAQEGSRWPGWVRASWVWGRVASTRGLAKAVHGGGQIPHGQAAVGLASEQVAPGPGAQPPGALALQHGEGGGG